jgi:hypothetical protein
MIVNVILEQSAQAGAWQVVAIATDHSDLPDTVARTVTIVVLHDSYSNINRHLLRHTTDTSL